ncbi:MAG TPA: hypothetical protein VET85_03080 [Stellaceae bacterium]|nr:hypothetical protein [Stellaceae bacterium]
MSGWRLFWALVGYVAYIVVLIFLYFYKPFEEFFTLVINGLGYDNAMFWAVLIAGIVGFCAYHWRAYRLYIVQRHSVDGMVLASLRGSAFIAVLFCAGAAVQSLQILCIYLLQPDYSLGPEFGARLGAVVGLVVLTVIFCLIFWVLKVVRQTTVAERA